MNIVESGTDYNKKTKHYIIMCSKTGLKRDRWNVVSSYYTLDEVGKHLERSQVRNEEHRISDLYKYKILLRHNTIKDTMISREELMVFRIKHGI